MNLLFDQNLSYKIADVLVSEFDNCKHLKDIGMETSNDLEIIHYAKENNFTIVTKDRDFFEYISYSGSPPKIIWIKTGNTSTSNITELLKQNTKNIKNFILNDKKDILEIE